MTYFYAGKLRELKHAMSNSYDISEQFKALGEIIDIMTEMLDPSSSYEEFKKDLRDDYKKSHGIDGLYFFKVNDYGDKYFCITYEQYAAIGLKYKHLEITEDYDLDQMFNSTYGIEFSKTGKMYYSLDDLKHDWLALKLAGIEQ